MNLSRHPDLIDRLAAQYALGVLRGGARRRFEQLARQEPAIRAAIGDWQSRLAGLAELQPASEPVDKVWCGIEQRLGWQPKPDAAAPAAEPGGWWRRLWVTPVFWRGATLAAAALAAVAIGLNVRMARELEATPPVNAVAVLNDERAQAAVLVTWDARSQALTLRRLDHLPLNDAQALQLWALPESGKPQSLGVIGHQRLVRLTVAQQVGKVPALAISVEPPGGSPDPNGPTGPVVFKGQVIANTPNTL
ncbi:anti-sigma factor [Cupriavidus basilensis]|uniref:Anti-sigma factor n=1 Tax=Cupriavidus basilensis TaxID=68895 RepID=A0ABT6AIR8_9BURK|nr:anti-sigma factor [Cupriavidus basilensis]MDF3832506.1 anti-sigma factor [Cupriavidus basilensis]